MRTTRNLLIATVAVAVTGAAVWFFTRDHTDPRYAWVEAADAACLDATTAIVERGLPAELTDDNVREFSAFLAERDRELIRRLEAIDAPDGHTSQLAETVTSQIAERAAIWEEWAAPDSELPDLATGEGGRGDEIAATYQRTAEAIAPWGGGVCGRNPLSPASAAGPTPQERWVGNLEQACLDAHEQMAETDRVADGTRPGQYLAAIAEDTRELVRALRAAGPPPTRSFTDGYNELIAHVEALESAAAAGDLDAARAANAKWREAAEQLGLPACAVGVASSPASPTNLLAEPNHVGPTGEGIEGGSVTDAAVVIGYTAPQLVAAARPEPGDAYSTRSLVPRIVDPAVTGVPGSEPASPTAVSISERRLPDPGSEPAEANPWVVGVAVADTAGNCMWSQLFGVDVLYGYTPPAPAAGPCTGDAAAAAYTP